MTADRESAGDKLEIANAVLQSDYQRWHVCKKHDLKAAISDMADKNIAFYDTVRQQLVTAGYTQIPHYVMCASLINYNIVSRQCLFTCRPSNLISSHIGQVLFLAGDKFHMLFFPSVFNCVL